MQIKSSMKRLAVGLTVVGIATGTAVETAFSRDVE